MAAACRACGYDNRLSAAYCGMCGASLALDGPAQPAGVATAPANAAGSKLAAAEGPPQPRSIPAATYPAVTLAVAGVAYLKLSRIDNIPFDIHAGETSARVAAAMLLRGDWIAPWSGLAGGQPTGVVYWMAAWASGFGDSPETMRLATAVLSLATLALFFLFVRSLFGFTAAVAGSALLAFGQWPLLYGSLALPVAALPLAVLASSYALVEALGDKHDEQGRRWRLAIAGLLFGLGFYTANTYLVFAAAVALLWTREFLVSRVGTEVVFRRSLAFLVPALLVAVPYLAALAGSAGAAAEQAWDRTLFETEGYRELQGVAQQTRYVTASVAGTAASLVWGSAEPPGAPLALPGLMDPLTALLSMTGCAVAAWRIRRRRFLLLWLILASGVIAAGLMAEAGRQERLVVAMPAIFAAAGVGVAWLLSWTAGRVPSTAIYGLIALSASFVGGLNRATHLGWG